MFSLSQHFIPPLEKKQVVVVCGLVVAVLAVFIFISALNQSTQDKPGRATNIIARHKDDGMVTTGLVKEDSGPCRGGYRLTGIEPEVLCTHGPDPAPAGYNMNSEPSALTTQSSTVSCDGDGTSGKRVEVIYAHASDVPNRFSQFQATFQQFVSDIDGMLDISASETGGSRHIRFVHNDQCVPTVTQATLSPTGDDTFSNTITELNGLGLNKISRKYIVFVDAHVYCGIATLTPDDTTGNGNKNNVGPSYGRIDAGCWTGTNTAHEFMHMLGAVQLTSPNSSGAWHCTDEYDRMCYSDSPKYPTMQYPCASSDHDVVFDCNHDDYFSTNPSDNSYLAAHWNSANNQFLIGATDTVQKPTPTPKFSLPTEPTPTPLPSKLMKVASLEVGTLEGGQFSVRDSFTAHSTLAVKLHIVDAENANVSKAIAIVATIRPAGTTQCSDIQITDNDGVALSTCTLSDAIGVWSVRIDGISKKGYQLEASSIPSVSFSVH